MTAHAPQPVELTEREYDFVWGLLAMQDPQAKILQYMVKRAAVDPDFIPNFNHTSALQKRLEIYHTLENSDHNPFPGVVHFDVSDHDDFSMLQALEQGDSIPRLYRPLMSSFSNTDQAHIYAIYLDDTMASIEENGVLITSDAARTDHMLLYAPINDKAMCRLAIKQGRAQREFFENKMGMALAPIHTAEAKYNGISFGIRPN